LSCCIICSITLSIDPFRRASLPASVSTTALSIMRMACLRNLREGTHRAANEGAAVLAAASTTRVRDTAERVDYSREPLGSRRHSGGTVGICVPAHHSCHTT
jgi:hypothetical protein